MGRISEALNQDSEQWIVAIPAVRLIVIATDAAWAYISASVAAEEIVQEAIDSQADSLQPGWSRYIVPLCCGTTTERADEIAGMYRDAGAHNAQAVID